MFCSSCLLLHITNIIYLRRLLVLFNLDQSFRYYDIDLLKTSRQSSCRILELAVFFLLVAIAHDPCINILCISSTQEVKAKDLTRFRLSLISFGLNW